MKKIGVIIFSRFDSSRLYGKALVDISGRSLLGRVIDQSKKIRNSDNIIIATSSRPIDDVISNFAQKEGLQVFRGSCDDVFARALAACKYFSLDGFARVCGDRPFFDPNLVDGAIDLFNNNNFDIVTTMFPRSYPPGLTTEIINKELLARFNNKVIHSYDREHLTTFFYRNSEGINIKNINNNKYKDMKDIKLVVDNLEDLKKINWIASQISKENNNDISNIIDLAKDYSSQVKIAKRNNKL